MIRQTRVGGYKDTTLEIGGLRDLAERFEGVVVIGFVVIWMGH